MLHFAETAVRPVGSSQSHPTGISGCLETVGIWQTVARLYEQAFREFGSQALWSRRASAAPTIAQALVIADALRREGNLRSRALAVEIEFRQR